MKSSVGPKSLPLDYIHPVRWFSKFATELLEFFWVLEVTPAVYPE